MTTPAPATVIEDPERPGIRIFDDAAIMAAVDKQTANLPAGKDIAVVAFVDTDKTVRLAATARLGDEWSIVIKGEKAYHKPIRGEAAIVWTPR